jgi:hypothetical protein
MATDENAVTDQFVVDGRGFLYLMDPADDKPKLVTLRASIGPESLLAFILAMVAALAPVVVSFGLGLLAVSLADQERPAEQLVVFIAVALPTLAVCAPSCAIAFNLGMLGLRYSKLTQLRTSPHEYPVELTLALFMARQLRPYSIGFRIWLAMCWLGTFCVCATFVHLLCGALLQVALQNGPWQQRVTAGLFGFGLHVSGLLAANVFLVLACKAATNSSFWAERLWRHRLVIDMTIAGVLLARLLF